MLKQTMDAKPVDYLAEINNILSKNGVNLTQTATPQVPSPAQSQGASVQMIAELMSTVNKAQMDAMRSAMELEFKSEKLSTVEAQVASLQEQLSVVNSTIGEVKNENIKILASREEFELMFNNEVTKREAKESEAAEQLAALNAKIEELQSELATANEEKATLEAANADLGAKLAGVKPAAENQTEGDLKAETINLSAEDAADAIEKAQLTDKQKLEVKYGELEKLAHTVSATQGSDIRRFQSFIRDNAKGLGIPLI